MNFTCFPVLLSSLVLSGACSFAQGVIGGNQNGLGPGGYLPHPPSSSTRVDTHPPSHQHRQPGGIVTALGVEGYDFQLVKIAGQPVKLVIDPSEPIIVPLVQSAKSAPASPVKSGLGFYASYDLENHTSVDRKFEFVDQYYAGIKITFSVVNSKQEVVWQSNQIEVDISPLAKKVELTLPAYDTWHDTVFVPLEHPDHSLLDPGDYTLQAEVVSTPSYMATAPFKVSTIVGGPIIAPVAAKK